MRTASPTVMSTKCPPDLFSEVLAERDWTPADFDHAKVYGLPAAVRSKPSVGERLKDAHNALQVLDAIYASEKNFSHGNLASARSRARDRR